MDTLKETDTSTGVKANQIVICKTAGCHDIATTHFLCRLHYMASWKRLKTKEAKKNGVELSAYLEDLSKRFPEEFLEKLRNEIEEMSERSAESGDGDEGEKSLFDQSDGDDDIDTIIKGLKVEDY